MRVGLCTTLAGAHLLVACENPTSSDARSSVQAFLRARPDFGAVTAITEAPPWARGARRIVATETGQYLFYLEDGRVVAAFTFVERQGRLWLTGTCYRAEGSLPESRLTCPAAAAHVT